MGATRKCPHCGAGWSGRQISSSHVARCAKRHALPTSAPHQRANVKDSVSASEAEAAYVDQYANFLTALDTPSVSVPDEIVELQDEILRIANELEFESSARGHEADTWVTVADCHDPAIAGNNCFAATHEVDAAIVTG